MKMSLKSVNFIRQLDDAMHPRTSYTILEKFMWQICQKRNAGRRWSGRSEAKQGMRRFTQYVENAMASAYEREHPSEPLCRVDDHAAVNIMVGN